MISGVDDPSSGEVRLAGHPMAAKPSRVFAALGLGRTFQHVRLLGQRSVVENVALGAHLRARPSGSPRCCGWTARKKPR
jgi:branched-chain amino acid transport system permease protein